MKKTMILLLAALMTAGVAFASGSSIQGKVTAVDGDVVTVEVEKGKGSMVKVGDSVEVEVKEQKKAPKKGGDMLQGC